MLRALSGIDGESEGERVSGLRLRRSLWADFLAPLARRFPLFWRREGLPRRTPRWSYVGGRLGRRLGAMLGGFWEVFGGQDGAKTVQVGPKTAQDGL